MHPTDGPAGPEALGSEECFRLLSEELTGRLVFIEDDDLTILPVNYLLDRGAVLIRTGVGSKLEAAVRGARVAFEIDRFDAFHRSGWSVLVRGRIVEVWQSTELEQVRRGPLQPWAPGEKEHYLVLFPSAVAGRRYDAGRPHADLWWGIAPPGPGSEP